MCLARDMVYEKEKKNQYSPIGNVIMRINKKMLKMMRDFVTLTDPFHNSEKKSNVYSL